MTERLVIEITGELPEEGKYAILAAADIQAKSLIEALSQEHKVSLTATVRSVRPGKSSGRPAKPAVRAVG
jgi:hypothetical protein